MKNESNSKSKIIRAPEGKGSTVIVSTKVKENSSVRKVLFLIKLLTGFMVIAVGTSGCSLEMASTRPPASANTPVQPVLGGTSSNIGALTTDSDSLKKESVIMAGDKVQLTVWGYPEFNTTTTVNEYGTITVPLVGEVIVAGLTGTQLAGVLRQRISEYAKGNVKLTVSHVGMNDLVSVLGAVTRQGNYSALSNRSLVNVLADAGGTTTDADLEGIKIYRGGDRSDVVNVNLTNYLRSGNVQYVPRVSPGDVVFVPEQPNFIRDFSTYASEVVFLFGFFALLK